MFLFAAYWALGNSSEQDVLAKYCLGCHNQRVKTADLSLEGLTADRPGAHAAEWEKVVRKLRGRFMPPAGLPRPDEKTYASLLKTIETSLDRAAELKPNPGRTDTFRRLTRTEYQNAIRDLLDLRVDVSTLLPSDQASHGFDNITVADLSPTLLERYLAAAQRISRLAVGIAGRSPGGDTVVLPPDLTQEEHLDGLPLGTRGGLAVPYTFPVDAEYDFQVRLTRDRNEHVEGLSEPTQVEIMVDRVRAGLFTVMPASSPESHQFADNGLHVRVPVKAGLHTVAVAFPKLPSALLETERQPYQAHFNNDRHPRITPAVYSLSVNGPYNAKGPGESASRRRLYVCGTQDDACARKILSVVLRRAWRRPVSAAEVDGMLRFYREGLKEGGFDSGIELALRAILVSPEFLFRIEQDPRGAAAGTAYPLNDFELASRLSFFLWSSIPDDELLDVASQNRLHEPTMLEAQVRRMLADRRSRTLVDNFAGQWLYLRNLASATPDMRAFPAFDDNLRQAMRRETELFFENIMSEDRSILDLVRSNYTFLNERLAKHYGVPNVYGSRFRKVVFDDASPFGRGGLLRQGSVLTVTSYATRTSPVIRGKWVLDNLLGVPPPPPPASVPALKEPTGSAKPLPMRERLAQHRANPACAGCHQLMDPVGFSLESFDAVGRWRVNEDGRPIDTSGGLPDGTKFDGVAGLEKALLSRPDVFATTFTEKLLTFATGRGAETFDGPAVRKIVREAGAKDYRFSAFVIGLVNSTPFQMRRTQ